VAANDPGGIADRIGNELTVLDSELAEIDLLIQQARSEADRHETKRSQTADRVATMARYLRAIFVTVERCLQARVFSIDT